MNNTPNNAEPLHGGVNVAIPKNPKREYNAIDVAFAWICFVFGYLFCRVFPVVASPFGGFLFIISIFASTTIVLKAKGVKIGVLPAVMALVAVAFSASLILSSNSFLYWLAYVFALCTYCYFVVSACGNTVKKGFSGLIAADYFNAMFAYPFTSVKCAFEAAFSGKAAKTSGKAVLKVLGGVFVALVPTLIVGLLLSYDKGFNELMGKIFDFNFGDIFSHIFSILFGLLIGTYAFGLYISSLDKKSFGAVTAESCEEGTKKMRIAPALSVAAACVPMLFIYVVFFISQWKYYVSGFTGVLPEEFSYAEYAREGFFQLCTVAFINLAVIICISLFMRRKTEKAPVLLKVLTIVYSVFTLVLISTALSKMFMYIESYGLTQKRVYSTCMMLVLAVLFVLLILKQFVPKIATVAFSLVASLALFAVLALGNVDGIIASYNVDRYIDGSLPTVDIEAMDDLGDAAVPELVRLAKYLDEKNGTNIAEGKNPNSDVLYGELVCSLQASAEGMSKEPTEKRDFFEEFFAFNVPALKAEKALAEIGLLK
ncbi:MAG: DUF4173 domain-containing protein [Clostridia bacterium]|nr:DUF4173 domain-containing protein [Clostridia bacterium]